MGEQTEETREANKDPKDKSVALETKGGDEENPESPDGDSSKKEALETEGGDEENPESPDGDSSKKEASIEEMYEESLRQIQEGELIKGEIIKIDEEYVLVDIGYKSEGVIRINEFQSSDGKVTAKPGDKIDVVLERKEDDEGLVILSMEKAKKIKVWDQVRDVYNNDGTIEGKVMFRVKGLHPIRDLDSLVGQVMELKILKYNKRRNNIIVSRRALLEAERVKEKVKTLSLLKESSIVKGEVKNITDYGLFVDLGGIDGLLHITDMSWGRVAHPSSMYKIGDEITVKIISFDKEKERVSLGLKQLKPDPWIDASNRFPVGTKVTGRVVNLTDYGAFIEIEEGVEALIHISEMSWTRKAKHPSQIVSIGDTVEAVVLNLDTENKRVSLGMKQIKPNPWDLIEEKYPVGTIIEGRIKNITDFGLFIGIDEEIDGLVHISDISWTKKIKHPSELYKKGDEVQAKVMTVDKDNERFSLGIKQLTKNPWEEIPEKYKVGTKVTGKVTNITDFGIFVELEEGIEGLVHSSEISKGKSKSPLGKFQIDDVIQALVVNVSKEEKKIALSLRKLQDKEFKDIYDDYKDSMKEEVTSDFGMLIKEKIESNDALNLQKEEDNSETQGTQTINSVDTEAEEKGSTEDNEPS